MIKLTQSRQFHIDLESVLEWLYISAIQEGRDPELFTLNFKNDFLKAIELCKADPFVYPAYGQNNPTRRAVLFHGNYILEYQLIFMAAKDGEEVEEIILTSLMAARSKRYQSILESLQHFDIDFEKIEEPD